MISAGRCYYRAGRTDEARQWLEQAMTTARRKLSRGRTLALPAADQIGAAARGGSACRARAGRAARGRLLPTWNSIRPMRLYEIPDEREEALALFVKFGRSIRSTSWRRKRCITRRSRPWG